MEENNMKRLVKKAELHPQDIHTIGTKSGGNIVYVVGFTNNGFENFQNTKLAPLLNMELKDLQNKLIEFNGNIDGSDVIFRSQKDAQRAVEWCKSRASEIGG